MSFLPQEVGHRPSQGQRNRPRSTRRSCPAQTTQRPHRQVRLRAALCVGSAAVLPAPQNATIRFLVRAFSTTCDRILPASWSWSSLDRRHTAASCAAAALERIPLAARHPSMASLSLSHPLQQCRYQDAEYGQQLLGLCGGPLSKGAPNQDTYPEGGVRTRRRRRPSRRTRRRLGAVGCKARCCKASNGRRCPNGVPHALCGRGGAAEPPAASTGPRLAEASRPRQTTW